MSTVENHNERQLQMGNGLTNVIIIVPISTDGEDVFESSYPRLPVVRIVRLTTQSLIP